MHPQLVMNWPAIAVCVVFAMALGFVWHGPLFGKLWVREMGLPADFKPTPQVMVRALALQIVGSFLTSYVLAHDVQIWRPSVWGAGTDAAAATYGFFAGFFVWLGFFLPQHFVSVAWEQKSWRLLAINAGYSFVNLQVAGHVLAHWR